VLDADADADADANVEADAGKGTCPGDDEVVTTGWWVSRLKVGCGGVPVPEAGDEPWLPESAESGNGTRPASVVGVGVVGVGVVGVGVVGCA
jgi:hypothetical protein